MTAYESKLHLLIKLLQEKECTKTELCDYFLTSERQVRQMISDVAKKQPVIATSDNRGYRIATKLKDLEDVKHTWAELSSRNEELTARIKPLQKWAEKAEEIIRSKRK